MSEDLKTVPPEQAALHLRLREEGARRAAAQPQSALQPAMALQPAIKAA